MTQSRQPLSLPVLTIRVPPGSAKAKPANRFRYAGLAAMLAAGVVLIQAFVIFSILRDQAHLSQPSKISTPLRP
jgi:hypothetical protein